MANEELIYRITRAVYGRLGKEADERLVEGLVTDIYQAVEPLAGANGGAGRDGLEQGATRGGGSADRVIVAGVGVDQPGIVAAISQILADADCRIIDINQTVVQAKCAMVIVADTTRARQSASELKERFRGEGERLGVRIYAQREDLFNAMHRV